MDTAPPSLNLSRSQPVSILHTSGTTGPPKGVIISHEAALHATRHLAWLMDYGPDDRLYTAFPLFHNNAKYTTAMPAMEAGGSFVMDQRFSVSRFWDTCREHGITAINYMGALLMMLFKQDPQPDDADNPVRIAFGAPCPVEIWEPFEERFDMKLVEVPRGTPGQIVARPKFPDALFSGYYKRPDATVEAWRNLWFHSGDRGMMDEDGFVYFIDRMKDNIRRRGENISSWEVESVVNTHPEIVEGAAYGVASELSEQEVMVAVVRTEGSTLGPEELLDFCQGKMSHFAVPRYVRWMDALPKNHAQRVQKFALRDEGITDDTWDRESVGYVVRR